VQEGSCTLISYLDWAVIIISLLPYCQHNCLTARKEAAKGNNQSYTQSIRVRVTMFGTGFTGLLITVLIANTEAFNSRITSKWRVDSNAAAVKTVKSNSNTKLHMGLFDGLKKMVSGRFKHS
jgi:hypothetical protein